MILELPPLTHIGYVAKTHGYRGEVSLGLKEGLSLKKGLKYLFIEWDAKPVPYLLQRINGSVVLLEGIHTEQGAKDLCGKSIYAETCFVKHSKETLDADALVGLQIIDQHGNAVGKVEGLEQYNQILIKTTVAGKEVLLPLNEQTLLKRDKTHLHLYIPEGLLEFYLGE